jgi:hypothetical protein
MTLIEMPFLLIVFICAISGAILGWQTYGLLAAAAGFAIGLVAGLAIDIVIVLVFSGIVWLVKVLFLKNRPRPEQDQQNFRSGID